MSTPLWALSATDIAAMIRYREVSCREVAESVLERIDNCNPSVNALAEVTREEALAHAQAADAERASCGVTGLLHGVPVTIKVNIDLAGHATTDGVTAAKENFASEDSPLVMHLKQAGAVIVGRSNTPAFSVRWFTDNDLHGRTLNPFDPKVTPGGSSGGAAAAVALGMGSIAHGNDYGGSIRYPAWACGVVGLRTTPGRIPSYSSTSPERSITLQLMSVQGPLTRTVADARLALRIMSQGSALDPNWVPVPLDYPNTRRTHAIAMFKHHPQYESDPSVTAAIEQAAAWLQAAGYEIDEVTPPCFEEGAEMWRDLVNDDLRRADLAAILRDGDHPVKKSVEFMLGDRSEYDRDSYLQALARRNSIARKWTKMFERYPVLLMPVSWQRQFPINADTNSAERMNRIIAAQSPLLSTAMLGLPGLSVPTGIHTGLPTGVQLVAARFREDLLLRAGEVIERASGFSALNHLANFGETADTE